MSRVTEPVLTRAIETRKILDYLAIGYASARIATELGCSRDHVDLLIREAAAELQKKNAEHVSVAFMQQDEAVMHLYAVCCEEIKRALVFPDKAITCAIKLLERRARLLGIDKAGPAAGGGRGRAFQWLRGDEGQQELTAIAKDLGIPIPSPFN